MQWGFSCTTRKAPLQATVETVVKVSGNRKVDKAATESANATQTTTDTITGTLKDAAEGGNATAKPKPKIDTTVEKEVDRIIDSQDNEYVLSKPKCVRLMVNACAKQVHLFPGSKAWD